jgi:hypothetical protein
LAVTEQLATVTMNGSLSKDANLCNLIGLNEGRNLYYLGSMSQ